MIIASRISTLTIEIANTRRPYKGRLKSRKETYTVGYGRAYDLFSFCCYRAMLLGSPAYISQAFLDKSPSFLTEILKPQKLLGEKKVGDMLPAHFGPSFCYAITFQLSTKGGWWQVRRDLYGHRYSDREVFGGHGQYHREGPIMDPPPIFADADDFRKKSQEIGGNNQPLTAKQAWDTWFWLLLNTTAWRRPKKNVNLPSVPNELDIFPWVGMDAPRQASRKPG